MSRAGKSGDAFATMMKLEERWDKEEVLGTPQKVMEWISACMASDKDFKPCTDTSWQGVKEFLKDGSVLCKLLNKLRSAAGMAPIKFKANAKISFQAMSNLENFNNGALEYGVPAPALFQTVDLVEGRKGPMVNVINCLNHLGFTANEKNYSPRYVAPAPPKGDF